MIFLGASIIESIDTIKKIRNNIGYNNSKLIALHLLLTIKKYSLINNNYKINQLQLWLIVKI